VNKKDFYNSVQILFRQKAKSYELHGQQISIVADQVRGTQLKDEVRMAKREGDMSLGIIPDEYLTTKEFVTKYNPRRARWYIDLLTLPVSIYGTSLVKYISSVRGRELEFVISRNSSQLMYSALEAGGMLGINDCFQEGKFIYFNNLPFEYENAPILIKAVFPIFILDDDDEIPVPDPEKFLMDVINILALSEKGEEHNTNDNKS
jgi:hypothetical protein